MSRRTKPSRVFLLSLLSTLVLSPQASYALSEPETAALMDVRAESDYQQLRSKWRSGFLGTDSAQLDEELLARIATTNREANKQWANMLIAESRLSLWRDLPLDDVTEAGKKKLGANLRSSYQRLFSMAKAYQMAGGELYQQPQLLQSIIGGLAFLNQRYYKPGVKEWGNWWHWELGIPKDIHNILIVLYEQLPSELIQANTAATRYFTPLPTHLGAGPGADTSSNPKYRESTGGNRTDNSQVVLLRGVLDNNAAEINAAVTALSPVVEYVSTSDGFYTDGSFIQHYDIAYNGTYGNVLLGGLGALIDLVAGSPWQATDPKLQEIYPIIFKSYAPFLFRGTMMEFVNGRAISRPQEQGHQVGHNVINSLLYYIDAAAPEYQMRLKQLIKEQITSDTLLNPLTSINHVGNYLKAKELVSDPRIEEYEDEAEGFHYFPAMERAVFRQDDWAFALALHSNRTGNFECMNEENRRGWFTGDGMAYLYTDQLDSYQDFWPAVDSYRLEGTTVDNQLMADCQGQRNQLKGGSKTTMGWVGGAKLDEMGVVGMEFSNWNDTLSAKKSWYMFDDAIVFVGSNIQSHIGTDVTTTVLNRKLPQDQTVNVYLDGQPWQGEAQVTVNSIRLTRSAEDKGSGYLFLQPTSINLTQSQRSGDWSEIGTKSGQVTANFITATQSHSQQNDRYAYIWLPEAEDLDEYVQDAPIKLVRQDESAHIVSYPEKGVVAATVWGIEEVAVTPHITVSGAAALLLKQEKGRKQIALTDPLQTQAHITLRFNKPVKIISDPQNRVQISGHKEVMVDMHNLRGQTYLFSVK